MSVTRTLSRLYRRRSSSARSVVVGAPGSFTSWPPDGARVLRWRGGGSRHAATAANRAAAVSITANQNHAGFGPYSASTSSACVKAHSNSIAATHCHECGKARSVFPRARHRHSETPIVRAATAITTCDDCVSAWNHGVQPGPDAPGGTNLATSHSQFTSIL